MKGNKMETKSRKVSIMQVDIYICPCGTAHTNGADRLCSCCERAAAQHSVQRTGDHGEDCNCDKCYNDGVLLDEYLARR